ncbi:14464_t:CDS:2 [Funneliformis geosporum]|uniref:14464_t:CDS:1 n=1 Tax=Funneliformis geosporum TaxID=1117311 RepID=A0A9W4SS04_9GLOM|nr:14464_t:CDS:2 [Funneliformis geosporum]
MWELTSGVPPFNNQEHDFQLCLNICQDDRPKIIDGTPICYADLMKRCWDSNPLKRPTAIEVRRFIFNWYFNSSYIDSTNSWEVEQYIDKTK